MGAAVVEQGGVELNMAVESEQAGRRSEGGRAARPAGRGLGGERGCRVVWAGRMTVERSWHQEENSLESLSV